MAKRKRTVGSVATELVRKSREAMLSAVSIYNNPQIDFKSELFIVTAVISWTYLLHAYYRKAKIDYRQIDRKHIGKHKRVLKTQYGAVRHWSLEECLDCPQSPVDAVTTMNLKFLIGIRHEIEHQMTTRIDDQLSAKFMACALNFNAAIKKLFGPKYSLESEQAFSIQFCAIDDNTIRTMLVESDLPQHIKSFVVQFENSISQADYDDPRFSYRVALIPRVGNNRNTADKVVQMVAPGSETANAINQIILKETEKKKYKPGTIVKQMKAEGYTKFTMTSHTELWQAKDGKNPKHQYGATVEGIWFWYEGWITVVRKHCEENEALYKPPTSVPIAAVAEAPRTA